MQTEKRLDRDSDPIQDYIAMLDRDASRPMPFRKLAALAKLGTLRRRLAAAVSRYPDPALERASAAAEVETRTSWWRRIATSFWGSKALMGLLLVVAQQFVLVAILILGVAYANVANRPPSPETGYLPAAARFSVVFLILFVFAFFFVTPFVSFLLLWAGRIVRSWRVSVPATVLLLLASSGATWFVFAAGGTRNPAFAPDAIHQFVESRKTAEFEAYQKWLDMNWLLKDPRFRADYESYLRTGPGRWLTNRFDTNDDAAWASPDALAYIGQFVDQEHDQVKFREWLKDYIERNRIYSRDIDVDVLVGPANQRFLSIWQAEPFLRDRDVNVRRAYYGEVFRRIRVAGLVFFGSMIAVYLLVYLFGPLLLVLGWIAAKARLAGLVTRIESVRDVYYSYPELRDLEGHPGFLGNSSEVVCRVHRGFVRAVALVTILVFGLWAVWMATRSADGRPMATQARLMNRFVMLPTSLRSAAGGPGAALNSQVPGEGSDVGPGGPGATIDTDGDGVPDEAPVPPIDDRLATLQKSFDDADYDTRKKLKALTEELLAANREIEVLRKQNAALETGQTQLEATAGMLGGRIGSSEGAAREAAGRAREAADLAQSANTRIINLGDQFETRTEALERRSESLEKRDDELQGTADAIAADLDERAKDLTARTERLGNRTTDLAERAEQIADLQRTAYLSIIGEFTRQIEALERRSESRLSRMFRKEDTREELANLRRRIQAVRGRLQASGNPDAPGFDAQLIQLQERIGPIEAKFR